MADKSKFIIIRGPSGSGKTTVARELLKKSLRPTLLVSEDQIRKMFNDHHQTGHKTGKKLATSAVQVGLGDGYDVIYEGILNTKTTGDNLLDFFKVHKKEIYIFYLDVGLEETLRRHQSRPERNEFKPEAVKKWWNYATPLDHTSEVVISESSSLGDTIRKISQVADLGLE